MNDQTAGDPEVIDRCRTRFTETLDFVGRVFPYGFRKSAKGKASPRARFEAIAVGSRFALDARPELVNENVADVLPWLKDKAFEKVTGSDGANAIARLKERTGFVRDRLLGAT